MLGLVGLFCMRQAVSIRGIAGIKPLSRVQMSTPSVSAAPPTEEAKLPVWPHTYMLTVGHSWASCYMPVRYDTPVPKTDLDKLVRMWQESKLQPTYAEFKERYSNTVCTDWAKMFPSGECVFGEVGEYEMDRVYEINCQALAKLPYPTSCIMAAIETLCEFRQESVRVVRDLLEWVRAYAAIQGITLTLVDPIDLTGVEPAVFPTEEDVGAYEPTYTTAEEKAAQEAARAAAREEYRPRGHVNIGRMFTLGSAVSTGQTLELRYEPFGEQTAAVWETIKMFYRLDPNAEYAEPQNENPPQPKPPSPHDDQ
mgnify:CR=1 FL=1